MPPARTLAAIRRSFFSIDPCLSDTVGHDWFNQFIFQAAFEKRGGIFSGCGNGIDQAARVAHPALFSAGAAGWLV
jgi:hypothetical protein